MLISNRTNHSPSPSFQARLVKGKGAQRIIKATMTDFYNSCAAAVRKDYFGDEPLDVRREYKNFQKTFKEITRGIGGKVKLFPNEGRSFPGEFVDLVLFRKGKKSLQIGTKFPPLLIKKTPLTQYEKPYLKGVEEVVDGCADAVAKTGVGYTEANKFHLLFFSKL